mgnify:CR=1 FL=1
MIIDIDVLRNINKINFISLVSQYRPKMSKNVLLFSVFDRSWCVVFATDINLASLVKQFSGRKQAAVCGLFLIVLT